MKSFTQKTILSICMLLIAAAMQPATAKGPVMGKALTKYWSEDYDGPMGIQVKDNEEGKPRMYVADELFYAAGANCYNIFHQVFNKKCFTEGDMERTFDVLVKEGVPVIRFSCIPWSCKQQNVFYTEREYFVSQLEKVAELADRYHIGLVPSMHWIPVQTSLYLDEPLPEWGVKGSKQHDFMLELTEVIVNTLKGHKCVLAWEFGNEFNLQADIRSAKGREKTSIPAENIAAAFKDFAELVHELDPDHRLITNGNGPQRNSQYHQMLEDTWKTDTYEQYVSMVKVFTPSYMRGNSEHLYNKPTSGKVYSDLGPVERPEQLRLAMKAAEDNDAVYYVGEFSGPTMKNVDKKLFKTLYRQFYDAGVQLYLVWNFSLKEELPATFYPEDDPIAFKMMRKYNKLYR